MPGADCEVVRACVLAAVPLGAVVDAGRVLRITASSKPDWLQDAVVRVPDCFRSHATPTAAVSQGVAVVGEWNAAMNSARTALCPGQHVPLTVAAAHTVADHGRVLSGPVPRVRRDVGIPDPLHSTVAVGKPLYLNHATGVDLAACVLGRRSLSSPSRPKSVLVAVSVPPRKPLASPTVKVKVCEGAPSTAWPVPLMSPAALAAAAAAAAVTATAAAAAAMPVSSTALVLTASASASASAAAAAAAAVAATPASGAGAGAAAAATAAVDIAATPASCAGAELTSFVVISPPRPCSLLERVRMLPTLTQGYSKSAVRWRAPALPGPRLPHWLAC